MVAIVVIDIVVVVLLAAAVLLAADVAVSAVERFLSYFVVASSLHV